MTMATKQKKNKISLALRPINEHRIRIIRILVQVISFGLINGAVFGLGRMAVILPIEFPTGGPFSTVWNAFEALQYAVTFGMFPYLAISIFILVGTIFGKTTCGWICPFGAAQDMFSYIPIKKKKVSRPTNKSLGKIGLVLVVFIILMSVIIGASWANSDPHTKTAWGAARDMPFSTIDPVSTIFATLYYYLKWGIQGESVGAEIGQWQFLFFLRLAILLIILVLITLYPRAYCRWFCPTGVILGFFSKFSILGLKINKNRCTSGCNDCEKACPVQVSVLSYDKNITDKACTNCGECIDACKEGALKISLRF